MKLYGVSGKINSGKDEIAKMIQYLNYCKYNNVNELSYDDFETLYDTVRTDISRTKIEKFGSKLKDIVCILLGCTREQLEDREFKEKELGEEWWYYGFGENKINGVVKLDYNSHKENVTENGVDKNEQYIVKLTPRLLLQLIGTECGREIIHPNIWVTSTLSSYKEQLRWLDVDNYNIEKQPNWVISDVRFPNEVSSIENLNGIVIRVIRGDNIITEKEHESETALDSHIFEYIIENNGTKAELLEKVKKIIENKSK